MKRIALDADDVVSRYIKGESVQNIRKSFGCTSGPIYRLLRQRGVVIRGNRKEVDTDLMAAEFTGGDSVSEIAGRHGVGEHLVRSRLQSSGVYESRNRIDLPEQRIVDAYKAGESVLGLAKAFDVSRGAIERVLRENGVAKRKRASRRSKERSAQACANASLGVSIYEEELAVMLAERGHLPGRQTVVGPYRCDLTLHPVAVEVWGGNWHFSGCHAERTPERFRYIMNSGWHVLAVCVGGKSRSPVDSALADYVVSYVERMRSNPSAIREYRVVRCAGKLSTGGSLHDDEIAVVYPAGSCSD